MIKRTHPLLLILFLLAFVLPPRHVSDDADGNAGGVWLLDSSRRRGADMPFSGGSEAFLARCDADESTGGAWLWDSSTRSGAAMPSLLGGFGASSARCDADKSTGEAWLLDSSTRRGTDMPSLSGGFEASSALCKEESTATASNSSYPC